MNLKLLKNYVRCNHCEYASSRWSSVAPVELDECVCEGAEVEEVVEGEVVVVGEGLVLVPASVATVVELNRMKKGALAWVTRPNPVKAAGLPNLVVIRYQRTSLEVNLETYVCAVCACFWIQSRPI